MSPRIDISIDELPEASSLLDGHDYSSQIIQRIAGVPVILDASGCPHPLFSKLNMMTGRLGLQVKQVNNLCGQCDTVEPAYRYRSAIRLAPVARIFIRAVIINLTML